MMMDDVVDDTALRGELIAVKAVVAVAAAATTRMARENFILVAYNDQ